MWLAVVLLIWLQMCCALPPPGAMNPSWHHLVRQPKVARQEFVSSDNLNVNSSEDEATINQFERELQTFEKLLGFNKFSNLDDEESPEFVMKEKRGRGANLAEINRFLARLLQFTHVNFYDRKRRVVPSQKKSLYKFPIFDLPPEIASALADEMVQENNLDERKNYKGQGEFEASKRSPLQREDSLQLTLQQLRGLISRVKDDENPLHSMMGHVAMEMKEETGNRVTDDGDYYNDWLSEENDDTKRNGRRIQPDGPYARYRLDRWYPIFRPRYHKPELAESKRGSSDDKKGYADKRGFGDKRTVTFIR